MCFFLVALGKHEVGVEEAKRRGCMRWLSDRSLTTKVSSAGGSITTRDGSKEGSGVSVTSHTEHLFNTVDMNGDGLIDRTEFRLAVKAQVISGQHCTARQ
eukprot:TRINITY_DN4482_c0_g1_i3.p1 TRINITY_DN4482_c0_g1~~TRINITY_DN4482_c0_g1_i3.p1  ORF type:complete len:109 (-),score=16.09 TRINITY_DN4482_c0_g1_i3:12-311(-)